MHCIKYGVGTQRTIDLCLIGVIIPKIDAQYIIYIGIQSSLFD